MTARVIAWTPTLALIVDRDAAAIARPRVASAPTLIAPLASTTIALALGARRERLDRTTIALVPARARYRLASTSPAPQVVTLAVSPAATAEVERTYAPHVVPATFAALLREARVLPRTRWVDELVHRYLFERDVCARHGSLATRFLETELIKELYFLADEQRAGRARAPVVGEGSALVERARAAIEASLFAPFAMAALARACHASESTLTRTFKQALGITPGAYVRERRLDEAMPLLESGRYSVGEVATRVGYARQAAFAAAFQRKFHVAPSRVRPRPEAPPLAPHGRPPVRAPRAGR